MVLVHGMILESMIAALILSSKSVPQKDIGEDLRDAAKPRTFSIRLRAGQVAPPQPGLRHPSVLEDRREVRIGPCGRVIMPEEEQLTSTPQLSLHDRGREPNGFRGLRVAFPVIEEQDYGQQVGLLGVNAFDLPTHVAPHQHVPTEKLDVTSAVAGLMRHACHLMGVVTNDP